MKRSGFTLAELLIVISLIVILASVMLYANISSAFQKSRDSRRKSDLNKLTRVFEDYYNDHTKYPTNNPATGIIENISWGSPFLDYPLNLPADPLSPSRDYYYETDPDTQFYFAIYAKLENTDDDDITLTGCDAGCGPNLAYNYALHSTNVQMIAGIPSGNSVGYPGFGEPTGPPAGPTNTPYPTIQLTPPVPYPNTCGHNQCCHPASWCGADTSGNGGILCNYGERCLWIIDSYPTPAHWECGSGC
jgi:prepilin-type N-terminal cleavage/methylation domain-containing protein